jgi:hypothetical protein
MKKAIYTVAALLMLGTISFSSCDKIKDLAKVNFNLDNADGEFTIPVIIAVGGGQGVFKLLPEMQDVSYARAVRQ